MVIQGGANLVHRPPAFANDGKRLLVCTASSVTVFSVATGLPVLRLNGHTDMVTSLSVIPWNAESNLNHVWTSSLDGTIRLWDFEVGNVVRIVPYGKPIVSMVIPALLKPVATKPGAKVQEQIAFISVQWDSRDEGLAWTGRVMLFNLSTAKPLHGYCAKTLFPQRLAVSPRGNFVGTTDKKKVWIWKTPDGTTQNSKWAQSTVLHHTKMCKVMAFDPTETVVACGDETGRILYWHNVGNDSFAVKSVKNDVSNSSQNAMTAGVRGNDDAEACTTFHWHAHEVKSLLFSSDGSYLFSGGSEGTLVVWQPETGKRQFLPRLGGELFYITCSPDPAIFAVSCSNNAIRFVNIGSMRVERTCRGISPVVPLPKDMSLVNSTRLAFILPGGKLILPTEHLSLQFYDTARDQELFEVQIASRNGAGSYDKGTGWSGPRTFVTHVTFSTNASIMATVDLRLAEEDIGAGSYLKFWDYQLRKPEYVLITLVDEPHGAEITALVCHPFEQMVVTCSLDATFRVWVRVSKDKIDYKGVKQSAWRCRSVGSYRHKQMLAAAFSPDGSLLAVAAEDLVTLWNPVTNGFVRSLICVPSQEKLRHLAFVNNSKCLVAASSGRNPRLVVWQLSTLSVLWSSNVYVEALSVDPTSSHFGIIALSRPENKGALPGKKKSFQVDTTSRKSTVVVFYVYDPTPIGIWSLQEGVGGTLMFGSPNLLSPTMEQAEDSNVNSNVYRSCLLVLTRLHEYVLLNPLRKEDDSETMRPVAMIKDETVPSAYINMYGDSSAPPRDMEKACDVIGILAQKPWGDLFNAPSHVLPSLTRLSLTFMESLLEKHSDLETQNLGRMDLVTL